MMSPDKTNTGFPCQGLCQKRFSGTRRAHHKHTARRLGPKPGIALWITEEVYQLADFVFGIVLRSSG